MRPVPRLALLLLPLVGCEHGAPFAGGSYGSDQPFTAGSPRRLTYNLGQDRAPAWLPDESGIVYSFERTDRPDRDRCLGMLPPDGGRLLTEVCDRTASADDSTNLFTEPAPDPRGRLAYAVATSSIGALTPAWAGLELNSLAGPATTRVLLAFPYYASDTLPHEGAAHVRWLGGTTLVYVAQRVGYEGHCKGCPLDSVRTGVAIDRLDLSQTPPHVDVLPGTRFASSVAVGATSDVIYFTLGGDSRVLRRNLVTGTDSTLFDFGASGITRDVQVIGSRLVAVVGGNVSFALDATLGYPVQRDSGGPVHVVDLLTGAHSVLTLPPALRHPALSPSGKRLVVEAYTNGTSDLWEFILP